MSDLDLSQFTGSERVYFNPLYKAMHYTDGVQYFANEAGAYWLLDIIGTEFFPKTLGRDPEWDSFLVIEVTVRDSAAVITVNDGNDNIFTTKEISYTDCPEGEWKFYLTDNVLLLPGEY